MKVVILAGGLGTRFAEETDAIPKPMIPIGKYPILVHIMAIFVQQGFRDFVIAAGYKESIIREYFQINAKEFLMRYKINVDVIDTGLNTSTAGRIHLLRDVVKDTFFLTYGDGVSNVNLKNLVKEHKSGHFVATVTAVRPPPRFGTIEFENNIVTKFAEKDSLASGWINGGFFVLSREIFEYIRPVDTSFENEPMTRLVGTKKLGVYKHADFWHPMDTLRDQRTLSELWKTRNSPWESPEVDLR